jgi:hypothetical protein
MELLERQLACLTSGVSIYIYDTGKKHRADKKFLPGVDECSYLSRPKTGIDSCVPSLKGSLSRLGVPQPSPAQQKNGDGIERG